MTEISNVTAFVIWTCLVGFGVGFVFSFVAYMAASNEVMKLKQKLKLSEANKDRVTNGWLAVRQMVRHRFGRAGQAELDLFDAEQDANTNKQTED